MNRDEYMIFPKGETFEQCVKRTEKLMVLTPL